MVIVVDREGRSFAKVKRQLRQYSTSTKTHGMLPQVMTKPVRQHAVLLDALVDGLVPPSGLASFHVPVLVFHEAHCAFIADIGINASLAPWFAPNSSTTEPPFN